MSTRRSDPARVLARFVAGCGFIGVVAGAVAWLTVRSQMAGERIVVPETADRLAGRPVKGPLTALEQANTIKQIALRATGGRTYSELEEGDGAAEMALNASLLRASLFASVLAFGVASGLMMLGGVPIAVGSALSHVVRRLPRQAA
jgi:hypothetical protein